MKKEKQKGQGLTELALILPLFLLLVMFIFDVGRVIYYYSTLHSAAREGARYGAVNPCDSPGIVERAQNIAVGLGDAVTVSPSIQYTPEGLMDRVIVDLNYQYNAVTPFAGAILGDGGFINLTSQSVKYIELKTACP
jgi:hypothetical protein